jgi:Fe-S oxidoreductase
MLCGYLLEKGSLRKDEEVAKVFYQCTGCLACYEACEFKIDVPEALLEMRMRLVKDGIAPYPVGLFRIDPELLKEALRRIVPKRYFVPEASACLFPGCSALLKAPDAIKHALFVLKALKVEFVGASPDAARCCGYPLFAGGFKEEFIKEAKALVRALRRYKLIVTLSPCCAYTLKTLYLKCGVEGLPRVTTVFEIVAPLFLREKVREQGIAVTAHDSCFMSRHLGLGTLFRKVITHANGMPPIEMRRSNEIAGCCGAGLAYDKCENDIAKRSARVVLDMAKDSGANVLLTGSLMCYAHMLEASKPEDVEVMEIMEFLAKSLSAQK